MVFYGAYAMLKAGSLLSKLFSSKLKVIAKVNSRVHSDIKKTKTNFELLNLHFYITHFITQIFS